MEALAGCNFGGHVESLACPVSHDETEFLVSWVGMDGSDQENEFATLESAQRYARAVSELGGHCITISDSEIDYTF